MLKARITIDGVDGRPDHPIEGNCNHKLRHIDMWTPKAYKMPELPNYIDFKLRFSDHPYGASKYGRDKNAVLSLAIGGYAIVEQRCPQRIKFFDFVRRDLHSALVKAKNYTEFDVPVSVGRVTISETNIHFEDPLVWCNQSGWVCAIRSNTIGEWAIAYPKTNYISIKERGIWR